MDKAIEILKQHYETKPEDGRLERDKSHSIEFITTAAYIAKYLNAGDRILEIGAGTGHYSLHYASLGYQVDALELLEHNINIFRSKITAEMNIQVHQGNALDLSIYPGNTFDVTLCFGPLYHLFTDAEKKKCIEEAIRVTKPNGYVYFAYLSNDAVFVDWTRRDWNNLLTIGHKFNEDFHLRDDCVEIFSVMYPEDFFRLILGSKVKLLHTVAADGIAPIIKDSVNEMTEEQFAIWTKFHLYTCEKPSLLGYSCHLLAVCQKEE